MDLGPKPKQVRIFKLTVTRDMFFNIQLFYLPKQEYIQDMNYVSTMTI